MIGRRCDETMARSNEAIAGRDKAIGLTGWNEAMIARSGSDEAMAGSDEGTAPAGCRVTVVVIGAGIGCAAGLGDGTQR